MTKTRKRQQPQRKKRTPKRKVAAAHFPLQRQFNFGEESQGRFFNLREIFRKMKAEYFNDRFPRYRIVWGRKKPGRPRNEIVFGSIQEEDRIIRVHPLLDRRMIPRWFVEYVVYHEMCHAVVRDREDSAGRRVIHHDGFLARERRYRWFRRAKRWEEENLGRFLE